MITVRDMVKNDEIWTPPSAIDPLIPYLPKPTNSRRQKPVLWEMCPGNGEMVYHLSNKGFRISSESGLNSLVWEPKVWQFIVTNPPWSLKHLFLQRCVEFNRPFALLLPIRTLGVRRCQAWLDKVDVLFLAKRVDFTGGGAPYEACAWFTRWMLPDRMVFE